MTAGLLSTLLSITAAACYAHGYGLLGSACLGLIVSLCIAAGFMGAVFLFGAGRSTQSSHSRPSARDRVVAGTASFIS